MSVAKKLSWLIVVALFLSIAGGAFAANSYDRELIVTGDNSRSAQVEVVFKELMAAYEDEDARGFLDLVSDDRFRQDYITFTDALYSDFRHYEIHHIDYWIDRVVPDHVKRFLYVRWEKRYENLDDGEQLTMTGYSRFLFDDIDGDYLLVELAGNNLFGASLPEWVEEVPPISGQEFVVDDAVTVGMPDLVVDKAVLSCGYPATLLYTVRNAGNESSNPCQLEISIYKDTYYENIQSLSIGETQTAVITVTNDSCPSGTPDDHVIVDSLNSVTESNENNNQSSVSLDY